MEMRTKTTMAESVAWVALAVAIVALLVGWAAYNRSGQDVAEVVREQVEEATAELQLNYEQLERTVRQNTASGLEGAAGVLDQAADDVATETPRE